MITNTSFGALPPFRIATARLAATIFAALLLAPAGAVAFTTGPPVRRSGVPEDGGVTCVVCHRTFAPANSDPRGSIAIAAANYVPGVTQTISVTVKHPDQVKWGFQLTARLASDGRVKAGTLRPGVGTRVRCGAGGDAPCAPLDLEFIEHNQANVTAVGAGFTFTADWTPPADAVGDIIFYAAGNATNNNRADTGDYIYNTQAVISPAACNLSSVPLLTASVSGASFQSALSPNSLLTLFGGGFQPSGQRRGLFPIELATGTLPTALSCMEVRVDRKKAAMVYVSDAQMNVQTPTSVSTGPVELQVVANPGTSQQKFSNILVMNAAATAPAVFTLDGKKANAQFTATGALAGDPAFQGATAVKAGDLVTLWATGLGATNPALDAGAIAAKDSPLAAVPTVSLNGVNLAASDVIFAGVPAGLISGVYRVNIRIPATATVGDAVVKVAAQGASSQDSVTIQITK